MKIGITDLSRRLRLLIELSKVRIASFAALCTACGFIIGLPVPGRGLFLVSCAIFLLSSGALILNQIQERDLDALLERTRKRPIPSGRCEPSAALRLSLACIISGLGIALFFGGVTFLLCLTALLLYNAFYTPLKRISPFAILPGAIAGALPPLIGWCAAGRSAMSGEIVTLTFFLFMWQFPHFLIHFLSWRRDYAHGVFPVIAAILLPHRLRRIILSWTLGMGIASLFLTFLIDVAFATAIIIMMINAICLGGVIIIILRKNAPVARAYMLLTIYGITIVSLIALDQIYPKELMLSLL